MPPRKLASYNEADVSDKPLFVSRQPLLPYADGWPMLGYCREMIGIDWLIEQITNELQANGHLDNTLLVFTVDNGSTWGAHRLGQKKLTPYATQIPLYMWSPSAWDSGAQPRNIDNLAVNIDLAPTFCDLADGCSLGPYHGGQTGPDGLSLVPLLHGAAESLGRDAVLETAWAGERTWQALRTTSSNALGQWHYIEWQDGLRELYDSIGDPSKLRNLGRDPSLENLRRELSVRLAELLQERRVVAAAARPDAGIATNADGPYKQFGVYDSVPTWGQTKRVLGVAQNASYDYWVRITNRGSISGSFLLAGLSSGSDQLTVTYLVSGADVTLQVEGGTYLLEDVAPNESITMVIRIRVAQTAPLGAKLNAVVRIASSTDARLVDVVKAVAER